MKKIFTLVSVALCAMSLNAQEVWKAADYNLENVVQGEATSNIYGGGTADAPDTSKPTTLKTFIITAETESMTMTAFSTPNGVKEGDKEPVAWELKGKVDGNDALIVDGCNPKFAQYLMGQGNPEISHWEFDEETDNGTAHRVYGTYWEPGMDMPQKGLYYRFSPKKSGTLKVAIYGNKNQNPTYIVDADTKQPLAPSTIDVSIFYQNTGFAFKGSVDTGDAEYMNTGKMPDDYVLQHTNGITQNRPVLGYVSFPVEAGKYYHMFNTKSQIGIYGFEFTAGATGISDITANKANANAPIYNLAGQRVNDNAKGILIQNGKKFVK